VISTIEFYMGDLEEAIQAYDAEAEAHPAGTFGSEATFLAHKAVEAARAVLKAWDEAYSDEDPDRTTDLNGDPV
jgi:hypothetical protein